MTNRNIMIAMRVLEILLQCLVFTTLSIMLSYMVLKYNVNEYSRCLMICPLVIAAYYIRKNIDNFFLFYILQILLFVAAILFGRNANERFIYFLEVILLAIYSGHIKISTPSPSEERVPLVGMIVMVICYGSGLYANNEIMIQSGLLFLIVFVIAEISYNNLDKVNNLFIEHKQSVNFPTKQLIRVNRDMMIISLIIVSLGMLIFYTSPYGNLFQIIGSFFYWLMGIIGSVLFKRAPDNIQNETTTFASTVEDTIEKATKDYVSASSGSFSQLINTLLIIMSIFISIFLITKICLQIKNYTKKKKYGADIIEFINPKKKNIYKVSRKNILKEESELDYNLKLRKIFKKKVKQGIGKKEIPINTFPEDVTRTAITKDVKEAKTYTDIYEKARYSNEKVDSEEIQKIKNIIINKDKDNSKKNK